MTIQVVPARALVAGDVFSMDGYIVDAVVTLPSRGPAGEVFVQVRREDDPHAKSAYLPIDYPCPLWREEV
jgi:hypothetical protein